MRFNPPFNFVGTQPENLQFFFSSSFSFSFLVRKCTQKEGEKKRSCDYNIIIMLFTVYLPIGCHESGIFQASRLPGIFTFFRMATSLRIRFNKK